LVALDVGDAPVSALKRLPFTTWLRLQRMIEGSQTMCVLVGSEPMARSSAGLTVKFGIRQWESGREGIRFGTRLFEGLEVGARVIRARARPHDEGAVTFATVAVHE
jgi:hypothetical protein